MVKGQRTKQEWFLRISLINVICEIGAIKQIEEMIGRANHYGREVFKKMDGMLENINISAAISFRFTYFKNIYF